MVFWFSPKDLLMQSTTRSSGSVVLALKPQETKINWALLLWTSARDMESEVIPLLFPLEPLKHHIVSAQFRLKSRRVNCFGMQRRNSCEHSRSCEVALMCGCCQKVSRRCATYGSLDVSRSMSVVISLNSFSIPYLRPRVFIQARNYVRYCVHVEASSKYNRYQSATPKAGHHSLRACVALCDMFCPTRQRVDATYCRKYRATSSPGFSTKTGAGEAAGSDMKFN